MAKKAPAMRCACGEHFVASYLSGLGVVVAMTRGGSPATDMIVTSERGGRSVARGDATNASDLDLIVCFELGRSLLDHGGLVMDLRELLGMRVDVIDEEAMRPRFRQHAMKEAIPL